MDWSKPKEVTDVDLAFGGKMEQLLPSYDEIPKKFKNGNTKYNDFVNKWFYNGTANLSFDVNEGIDPKVALRHLAAIMKSLDPKHEHKMAGVAYLASLFFSDVSTDPDSLI